MYINKKYYFLFVNLCSTIILVNLFLNKAMTKEKSANSPSSKIEAFVDAYYNKRSFLWAIDSDKIVSITPPENIRGSGQIYAHIFSSKKIIPPELKKIVNHFMLSLGSDCDIRIKSGNFIAILPDNMNLKKSDVMSCLKDLEKKLTNLEKDERQILEDMLNNPTTEDVYIIDESAENKNVTTIIPILSGTAYIRKSLPVRKTKFENELKDKIIDNLSDDERIKNEICDREKKCEEENWKLNEGEENYCAEEHINKYGCEISKLGLLRKKQCFAKVSALTFEDIQAYLTLEIDSYINHNRDSPGMQQLMDKLQQRMSLVAQGEFTVIAIYYQSCMGLIETGECKSYGISVYVTVGNDPEEEKYTITRDCN